MKDTALNNIERIKSDSLREIAEYLIESGNLISFFGQAWSNAPADWVYFDTVLDLDRFRKDFKLKGNIIVHENLDSKSGLERGLIDKVTGEGLMGKIK